MERLYVFLIRNDVWIFIICGLGLLWYLNEFIRSYGTARRAMFGLERETALRKRNKALLLVVILSVIVVAVIYVNTEIRPTLPPEILRPPTPSASTGPVPTLTSTTPPEATSSGSPTPTSPIAPTVTLVGQTTSPLTTTESITSTTNTTSTQDITAPPGSTQPPETEQSPEPGLEVQPAGCSPDAIITEPREDASVLGLLNVFGSASTEDFGHYEIEIRGPQTNDRWASLVGRRIMQPVRDGILAGNVDLSGWAQGTYDIRLLIYRQDEQWTHQCQVSIILRTGPGDS